MPHPASSLSLGVLVPAEQPRQVQHSLQGPACQRLQGMPGPTHPFSLVGATRSSLALPRPCDGDPTRAVWMPSAGPPDARAAASRNALEATMYERFVHGGLLCISGMLGTCILLAIALVRPTSPCAPAARCS